MSIEPYRKDIAKNPLKLIMYMVAKEFGSLERAEKMDVDELMEAYTALVVIGENESKAIKNGR